MHLAVNAYLQYHDLYGRQCISEKLFHPLLGKEKAPHCCGAFLLGLNLIIGLDQM
jgi:hypothetical protein